MSVHLCILRIYSTCITDDIMKKEQKDEHIAVPAFEEFATL